MAKQKASSLAGYVTRLTRDLSHLLPRALEETKSDSIHRVRVTTRRLGSVIHLLSSHLNARKREVMEKDLRKLRRRLGQIRDLDVMLSHLPPYRQKYPRAVRWLATHLRKQRKKAARQLPGKKNAAAKTRFARSSLTAALAAVDEKAKRVLASEIRRSFSELSARADQLAEAKSATGDGDVDVHALRISGKHLRYSLELVAAAGASLEKNDQQQLKKIQDLLGQWHDYAVLAQFILTTAAQENVALMDAKLLRELLDFVQELSRSSEQQLDAFKSAWKKFGPRARTAVKELLRTTSTKGSNDSLSRAARKSA